MPWGCEQGTGPANPGFNPWNTDTHRLGYVPNVEDWAEWEELHRDDEAEDEGAVWVKSHDRRKRGKR